MMNLEVIQRELQATTMLKNYGLDFRIEKRQLVDITDQVLNPNDDGILPTPTPFYGLKNMRTGEYIHNVKKGYVVSQNIDIVKAVLKGIRGFGSLSVTTGGPLNGGRKIFLQLGIEGYEAFGNNDSIKKYLTLLDSNDGSQAVCIGIGTKVMSCGNQSFRFYKEGFSKIRHSSTLEQKMEELPYLITVAMQEHMKMFELYKEFESTVISKDLAHRMVDEILGVDKTLAKEDYDKISGKKKNQVEKLYETIKMETSEKGDNLWGLLNGVTRWTTHERSVPRRTNGRVESLIMGSAYRENEKALNFCKRELILN